MKALPFVDFVERVLGVRLSLGQRTLVRVAFDGVDPCDLEGDERGMARQLFGNVERIPRSARAVLVAVCGARGGKSYVLGGLYSLWRALTADLSTLAPGEVAVALIVAERLSLARQTMRYALGAAKSCPDITELIGSESSDAFLLVRDDGAHVAIECLPAARGGSALRGRSLVSAMLDEAAFFRDENFAVNDAEVFRAVAPRVLPGGMVVIASTPWAEAGLLFDEFTRNFENPRTAIACRAPTLLLWDSQRNRDAVARERERDPENAIREFDAEFMPAGTGLFFDSNAISDAVDPHLPMVLAPRPDIRSATGGDLGFVSDSSAFVTVRVESGFFVTAEVVELRPKKGAPLQPSVTIASGVAQAKRHASRQIVTDQHYIESVREQTQGTNVMLVGAPGGMPGKVTTYSRARVQLHEGRVRIPAGQKRLIAQLRDVVSKPVPGGGLRIWSPRKGGAHGDIASAWVLAVWSLAKRVAVSSAYSDLRLHSRGRHRVRPQLAAMEPAGNVIWSADGNTEGGWTELPPKDR